MNDFDKWWDTHSDDYLSDSAHMSAYHMAHIVWNAAKEKDGIRLRDIKEIALLILLPIVVLLVCIGVFLV